MPNAVIIAQQARSQADAIQRLTSAIDSLRDTRSNIVQALNDGNPAPDVFYGQISDYRFRLTRGRNDPHRFNVTCDFGLKLAMAITDQELRQLMDTTDEDEREADSVGMFLNGKHVKVVLTNERYVPQRFVRALGYVDYYGRTLYADEPVYPRGYDRDRIGMIEGEDEEGIEVRFEDQDDTSSFTPDDLIRVDI